MHLLYCSDPLHGRLIDPAYERERDAAQAVGFTTSLISYETLVGEGDATRAVRRVEPGLAPAQGLYRGWMLRPDAYSRLYDALLERGLQLINTPEAYRHCHYLPASYAVIANLTPKTVWMPLSDANRLSIASRRAPPTCATRRDRPPLRSNWFQNFVKSRKHEWAETCYIPSAADREAVERVVRRFVELQGEDLNEGLVFREFVPFEPLTTHSKSGMPLTREYRAFILDGEPILTAEYWEEGDYAGDAPPVGQFADVMHRVQSRFFTMDVAKRVDGDWVIVELGDGQVAGLPDRADADAFYRALAQHLA